MYVARGSPGRKHLTTGSRASQFASFSFFLASTSGRYGSGPSSTTPTPAGIPPAAPITTSGPAFASCAWMSHSAVFMACQIPLKSGLPSAVRGALYVGAAPAAGAFCANAGNAMISGALNTTTATIANLLDARIQILPSNRVAAHHGFGPAGSVVPRFQQDRDRYKIDSTFIPATRDASAFSTIGPVIWTSWPTWK